ncbi:hypothetical protein M436DRAFT_61605 [Aureobasidium namibiae CBS 147.97]|uniref:Uncharacterized protein n=1 Tax=Aureobasidium namibiae CBS 147.97 TaxID=1043004 RepID=A0A074X2W9_9PEZI
MYGGNWTTISVSRLRINENAVLRNNPNMPQNDAAFCVWVLKQLHDSKRYDMVEPFFILGNGLLDIRTVYQRLESGHYVDAAGFQRDLFSIPTKFIDRYPGNHTLVHEKANNLLLTLLPERFAQRNRWEGYRRRSSQQQQQQPVVPSTSVPVATAQPVLTAAAAAAAAAPALVQSAASDAVSDTASNVAADPATNAASVATPNAHQQSRFSSPFVIRTSATPKPSGRPPTSSRQETTGLSASKHRASEHPARPDPDDTSRHVSEAVDLDSERREARRGKKRAADDLVVGSSSKRARQEVEQHKYHSELRIQIVEVIDQEMKLVYGQEASMELEEGAQRYIDQLSQMDAEAKHRATASDQNVFKEDHKEKIEKMVVKYIREELNKFLAAKGQYIQPRLSLSSKMKNEDEEDEKDDDSEEDSKPRVKKERD